MPHEWTMPRRNDACTGCQRGFAPGETLRTLLFDTPAGYERRDYCLTCVPPLEPAPLGVWKTRRPEPSTAKNLAFDREAIYGFFERLDDADDPRHVQFRFVLALLLWRKKVLRLERSAAAGGREVWEFIMARSGALHRVVRPELDEAELERLSAQLEQLLSGQAGALEVVPPELRQENADA